MRPDGRGAAAYDARMDYRITGLSADTFRPLFGLPDEELARRGAKRYVANIKPGFPDRVELRDAEPGETLILVNHVHLAEDTPYRASHAVNSSNPTFV